MSKLVGILLLLVGGFYVLGCIFHRMIWMLARSLTHGLMLFVLFLGVFLLFGSFVKK